MARKIQALSDPIKDFIAEMFIILAKLDFRIKFLNWYVKEKVDVDSDEGKEKVKEVQHSISQANEMISKITEFIAGSS